MGKSQFVYCKIYMKKGYRVMKVRRMPAHFYEYYGIAVKLRLRCPKGRALYAINRLQNEGGGMLRSYGHTNRVDKATHIMKRADTSTAKRWLDQWEMGGHIKALGWSVEAYNERRRFKDRVARMYPR